MRRSRKTKQKDTREFWKQRKPSSKPPPVHGGGGDGRFYGCYLLTSLSPRHKGHTYIGFTVNPKRRIRQHNGEITSGASSTRMKRPWDMVLCIHGFPTNVAALQFEWAWQHPKDSVAVRETAASFKTLGGLANKIKLALAMLTLPIWNRFDLTVSFFSTSYMKHAAGCPTLPDHIKLHFSSLDELPCYSDPLLPGSDHDDDADDDDDLRSYLNHDNVDVFDNLNGPPIFGSIETDPSSINYQSHTQHNAPDHICNHRVIDGPSHDEPLYVIPDSGPQEQSSIFPSHTFSSSVFPILKKHNLNDNTDPSKGEPSRQTDPSVGQQLSKSDYVSVTEKAFRNDDFTYVLIEESPEEKRQRKGKYLPPQSPADIVGPSCTDRIKPVEVIDLYTPSPDCRIVAVSKKSRVSGDYSNFIDLTRSPLFFEL